MDKKISASFNLTGAKFITISRIHRNRKKEMEKGEEKMGKEDDGRVKLPLHFKIIIFDIKRKMWIWRREER